MKRPISEAEKARKAEWQRKMRAERVLACQCLICGAKEAGAGRSGKYCAVCVEKIRVRTRQVERRAEREAQKQEKQNAPGAPVCGHCQSREVVRGGRPKGIQRYLCRRCGRFSQGFVPAIYRCPYCRTGTCFKLGKAPNQSQMYRCRDCGRRNTALWPHKRRDTSEPKYTHRKTFCLGPRASQGLLAFTLRTQMSTAQAIRAILRREAVNPTRRWAGAQRTGNDEARVSSTMVRGGPTCEISDADVAAPLPDLYPQWLARRLQQENYQRFCPVAVVEAVTVYFDDTAKRGLLRVMRSRGLNHQEAMRFLLAAEIRAPAKKPPAEKRIHPWKRRRRKPQTQAGEPGAHGEHYFQPPL